MMLFNESGTAVAVRLAVTAKKLESLPEALVPAAKGTHRMVFYDVDYRGRRTYDEVGEFGYLWRVQAGGNRLDVAIHPDGWGAWTFGDNVDGDVWDSGTLAAGLKFTVGMGLDMIARLAEERAEIQDLFRLARLEIDR